MAKSKKSRGRASRFVDTDPDAFVIVGRGDDSDIDEDEDEDEIEDEDEDEDEDFSANTYCPTGQGGGVDPRCGSKLVVKSIRELVNRLEDASRNAPGMRLRRWLKNAASEYRIWLRGGAKPDKFYEELTSGVLPMLEAGVDPEIVEEKARGLRKQMMERRR